MSGKFSDYLTIKPGDIIWVTPKVVIESDDCVGVNEQEIGITVKTVIFSPSRKKPVHIEIYFDKVRLKSSDDYTMLIKKITLREYNGNLRMGTSADVKSRIEPTFAADIGFSSIVVEKR
jgi:hypothetical protein